MCIHAVYEYIWWTREEFVSDKHVCLEIQLLLSA